MWETPPFYIPYGALVPEGVSGILVAGRCFSMDQRTIYGLNPRDLITCMASGEAAGTASNLSVKRNIVLCDFSHSFLLDRLREQGGNSD